MATITNPNWFDLNADRAFPFLDGASRESVGGGFVIPDDLIVDLKLSAPPSLDPTRFYLSRLKSVGNGLALTFAVDGTGDVAEAAVSSTPGEEFQTVRVVATGPQGVTGTVVLGGRAAILAAGAVEHDFAPAATPIVPTLILPSQGGVTSITIRDAVGAEYRLVGDVVLVEGSNAELSVSGQEITVGMQSGVVIDPCPCPDPTGANRPAVRSIMGVTPDENGNIDLEVEGCPELSSTTNGLRLVDRCAQPCCGDAEIEALVNSIQDIDRFLADLANRAAQLESGVRSVEAWLVQ